MIKVSILISTYNGESDLRPLLDSIAKLEYKGLTIEVLLRDDGSSDNTLKIVDREYDWVTVIRDDFGNIGFVKSNNLLYNHAQGNILCCVNQDTILHPKFLVEAVDLLNRHNDVIGINTNMIMPSVMSVEEFQQTSFASLHAYEFRLTRFGIVQYVQVPRREYSTNFMTGGGFFVRRDVVDQWGYLFDPRIDMYCEDTELSIRIKKQGNIFYCPSSIIYHNQTYKRGDPVKDALKILKITRNRFALFARVNSTGNFVINYPLFLLGIVYKMYLLPLRFPVKIFAMLLGVVLTLLFLFSFPCWVRYSLKFRRASCE